MKKVTKIGADIKRRTISAVCLVSVLLGAIVSGTPFFHYSMAVLSGLIFFEWVCVSLNFQMPSDSPRKNSYASVFQESNRESFFTVYVCMFCFILLQFFSFFCEIWTFVLLAGLLLVKVIISKFVLNKTRAALSEFGIFYIFLAVGGLGRIYNQTNFVFVLWMFSVIWLTDTGAFFCGKFFGKTKLAPRISPGKTWEGFVCGSIFSVVCELVLLLAYFHKPSSLCVCNFVMLTSIASVCAHIGDLLESAAKRHFKVKDMGKTIPGHGGFADRFDSLLFVSIVMWLLLAITNSKPF